MAIRTREEILSSLNTRFGDDTSDEVLGIIEDVTDTFNDLETRAKGDGTDWKKKYEDNDKEWRQKYKDRFMNGDGNIPDDEPPEPNEPPKVKTFEELFAVKEEK